MCVCVCVCVCAVLSLVCRTLLFPLIVAGLTDLVHLGTLVCAYEQVFHSILKVKGAKVVWFFGRGNNFALLKMVEKRCLFVFSIDKLLTYVGGSTMEEVIFGEMDLYQPGPLTLFVIVEIHLQHQGRYTKAF